MKFTSTISVLATISCVTALPALQAAPGLDIPALLASLGPAPATDKRFTDWKPPGPNDVRSPCPGLNTLANHGFLHRDGRNMTIPHLLQGLAAGLNMGPDFTVAIGGAGLLASPNPLGGSFDLNQLDQHNFPIEHDSSLSRQDAYFGNDYSFNDTIWNTTRNYYKGMAFTSIPVAAKIRSARFNDSLARNPTFTFGFREFILAYGETALYLQSMGSSTDNGVANFNYVRELFEKERLPFAQGWRPSPTPITLTSLGQMILQLYQANPGRVPEGQKIVADSYKNVFEVLVGGSEIFANLTMGISKYVGL